MIVRFNSASPTKIRCFHSCLSSFKSACLLLDPSDILFKSSERCIIIASFSFPYSSWTIHQMEKKMNAGRLLLFFVYLTCVACGFLKNRDGCIDNHTQLFSVLYWKYQSKDFWNLAFFFDQFNRTYIYYNWFFVCFIRKLDASVVIANSLRLRVQWNQITSSSYE